MRTLNSSLMDLTVNDGEVVSWRGDPFDRVAYSRFKYGFLPPAVDYGYRLAALVASRLWEMSAGQPVRIVSAPYKYLPTASHAVPDYMCQELVRRAVEQ